MTNVNIIYKDNIFFSRIIIKFKKRQQRLLIILLRIRIILLIYIPNVYIINLIKLFIPYIIWPLLFFIIDNSLYYNKKISLHDLKLQLIIGRQFSIPLWFLFSMIILTILFIILSFFFKYYFLFVLQILSIFSYIMQYSHYFYLFEEYKDNVKFSIIRHHKYFAIIIFRTHFFIIQCN